MNQLRNLTRCETLAGAGCARLTDSKATMKDKIFETNSSFHVKSHTMGKVQFLLFGSF